MLFTLTPSAMPEGYGEALLPLDAVKAWCGVLSDDFDDLLKALRDASLQMVEQYCAVRLAPVTGQVATFATFGPRMRVGIGPIATLVVTGISYTDRDGASVVLDAGGWRIDPSGSILPTYNSCWPTGASDVVVTFDAGYPEGAAPPALINAAKLFIAFLFSNRDTVVSNGISGDLPLGFTSLCDLFRMPGI